MDPPAATIRFSDVCEPGKAVGFPLRDVTVELPWMSDEYTVLPMVTESGPK